MLASVGLGDAPAPAAGGATAWAPSGSIPHLAQRGGEHADAPAAPARGSARSGPARGGPPARSGPPPLRAPEGAAGDRPRVDVARVGSDDRLGRRAAASAAARRAGSPRPSRLSSAGIVGIEQAGDGGGTDGCAMTGRMLARRSAARPAYPPFSTCRHRRCARSRSGRGRSSKSASACSRPLGQQGEHLAELVLGAVAVAEAQQAVGQQDADLEEGGIEVEGGAVGGDRLLGAAAEVVEEPLQGVGGRLGGVGGQGLLRSPGRPPRCGWPRGRGRRASRRSWTLGGLRGGRLGGSAAEARPPAAARATLQSRRVFRPVQRGAPPAPAPAAGRPPLRRRRRRRGLGRPAAGRWR